jgi:hypothetical protein
VQIKYWLFGLIALGVAVLLLVRRARGRARETTHIELPLEAGEAGRGEAITGDAEAETAPAVLGPPEERRKSA